MITRPMKGNEAVIAKLKYPLLATPKLDGIRCLKLNGKVLSASLKPIRNEFIAKWIGANCPDGFDGELMLRDGAPINEVNSAVMSRDGEPDFIYNVFDFVANDADLERGYNSRISDLYDWRDDNLGGAVFKRVHLVTPVRIENEEELTAFEERMVAEDHEGIMVRSYDGPYKCGYSTVKEGYLLKIKRFVDAEALVIGFVEQMRNENEQTVNELGLAKRSTAKAGLVPAGILGAIVARDLKTGVEFEIGTGFNHTQKATIWMFRKEYLGQLVTYKYQLHGVKDKPRIPVFKFFRDPDDMS